MPPIEEHGLSSSAAAAATVVVAILVATIVFWARRLVARARAEQGAAERRVQKERERSEVLERDLKVAREAAAPEVRAERLVLEGVSRALRDLGAAATREDVATALGRGVVGTLSPRQWMVFLAADEDGRDFAVAASGAAEGTRVWRPGARLSGQVGKVGLAVRRRVTVERRDLENEPPIVREQVQKTEPADFDLDLAVPVTVGDKVVAVIAVGRPEPLVSVSRTALEALAQVATVVLRGLAARDRAERIANQDTLTGVGNRSWFNATAAEELYRIRQDGGRASVVMFGVEHFQKYVRSHGNQAADKLLRGIAQVLRPLVTDEAMLARWGADEFVVFLPDTDLQAAWTFAVRARRAVAQVDWPFAATQPGGQVKLCAGLSAYPSTAADLEALIEAASAILADAKTAGGDTAASVLIEPLAARAIAEAVERARSQMPATR